MDDTPFSDNTVDVAPSLFSTYESRCPLEALQEIQRVTIPGGKIIVATSGTNNKPNHRKYENQLGAMLEVKRPRRFNTNFTQEIADVLLRNLFCIDKTITKVTEMVVRTEEDIMSYCGSIDSMYPAFDPPPSGWGLARRVIVEDAIRREVAEKGRFTDIVYRVLYVCTNDKK